LGLQVEDIDPRKSLSDYGVDSLMSVELRNWIWRSFKASVAVFDIMGGKSLKGVAQLVAEKAE
jgi:acyl carrier protein